jgi:membrane dipeptidase
MSIDSSEAARPVRREALVIEGHRDCYEQVYWHNMGEENPVRDRLLPRLRTGGVDVSLYAIGGDTLAHSSGRDKKLLATLENIMDLREMCAADPAQLDFVHTREDLPERPDGITRLLLHLEGGSPLEGSMAALECLFEMGVRSMQPTWNVRNELGDGVHEKATGSGLTRFGLAVCRRMGELGMLLDLSHMSSSGFWSVMGNVDGPIVVTHANCSGVYEHPRNLTDDQVRAIAERGGTVGLHSLPTFVGSPSPTLKDLVAHARHIAELVGPQHLAIGTDFVKEDGPRPGREALFHDPRVAPPVIPGLEEADDLPNLEAALIDGGFSQDEVAGIMGANLRRVLESVLPKA